MRRLHRARRMSLAWSRCRVAIRDEEANERLSRNHGMVASFSRALSEGLKAQQTARRVRRDAGCVDRCDCGCFGNLSYRGQ